MAVLLHSLTAYLDKMESLPKGWQLLRHALYINDGKGKVDLCVHALIWKVRSDTVPMTIPEKKGYCQV